MDINKIKEQIPKLDTIINWTDSYLKPNQITWTVNNNSFFL